MGLQLIAQSEGEGAIQNGLGEEANMCEVFNIEGDLWGISVPTKIVDGIGENELRRRLSGLNIYDLYSGEWRYA